MNRTDVAALEQQYLAPLYRRADVLLVRGEGVYVYDSEGRRYLDLLSGIGVNALGHGHPELAAAIADQARTMIHCSNLYMHPLQAPLAARLADMSGLPRVFFCNSGTEAVEACLKFARRFWHTHGDTTRRNLVALTHAFHGRSYGSLSVTAEEKYRAPFAPLLPDVRFVDPADASALGSAIDGGTAAVIVEPLQGEGGVRPLTQDAARVLREACAGSGALLIADEVQCGLGRTGTPFFFHQLGLSPDLVSIGKALGGGVPIGAALVSERVAATLSAGDHGSTYGGNPLACRAALVVLGELLDRGLMRHVAEVGRWLGARLSDLKGRVPNVVDVRGAGLMWGIELSVDATTTVEAALRAGLLVNRTAGTVVRLLPPLTITQRQLEEGLEILERVLAAIPAAAGALA
jgi:acetylornithine/N-succinyldiaminopimelate aminotransferase